MSKQETPDLDSQTPSGPVQETNGVNYETLSMIKTAANQFHPCGFLKNG